MPLNCKWPECCAKRQLGRFQRITLLMSAQGLGPMAVEAMGTENFVSRPNNNIATVERYEGRQPWTAIFVLLVAGLLFAYAVWLAWHGRFKAVWMNMQEG